MAEREELEAKGRRLDWRTIEWRVWFGRTLVVSLVGWILAAATRTIVLMYFFHGGVFISPEGFVANTERGHQAGFELLKACVAVESVAFHAWIASAVILAFLIVRDRASRSN